MEVNIFIILALVALARASGAIMDLSSEGKLGVGYWNKDASWQFKWKYPRTPTKRPWYYLWLYKPRYKERFPYSSTLLVSFTDGWHLMKSIHLHSFYTAIIISSNLPFWKSSGFYLLCMAIGGVFFELIHNRK